MKDTMYFQLFGKYCTLESFLIIFEQNVFFRLSTLRNANCCYEFLKSCTPYKTLSSFSLIHSVCNQEVVGKGK